jgi:hypothetical protein
VLAGQRLVFAHESSNTYGHGLDALNIIDPRDGDPVEGDVVAHGDWREETGFRESGGLGNLNDGMRSVYSTTVIMLTMVEVD